MRGSTLSQLLPSGTKGGGGAAAAGVLHRASKGAPVEEGGIGDEVESRAVPTSTAASIPSTAE
uniref:Uncharacterized protein n=1 Tax=Oryza nivara TaxID=4536 RepID=A0A0E0I8X4_ORYNI